VHEPVADLGAREPPPRDASCTEPRRGRGQRGVHQLERLRARLERRDARVGTLVRRPDHLELGTDEVRIVDAAAELGAEAALGPLRDHERRVVQVRRHEHQGRAVVAPLRHQVVPDVVAAHLHAVGARRQPAVDVRHDAPLVAGRGRDLREFQEDRLAGGTEFGGGVFHGSWGRDGRAAAAAAGRCGLA
jgi:hypothetical protein